MYKLIAIDMDGTLLTDDLEVTPGTIKAIQQAVAKGTTVTIATGRMYASAKQFAEKININVPLITYQGALIQDVEAGEVIYERLINPEISRELIDIAEARDIHLQVYQDDILYSAVENDRLKKYAEKTNVPYKVEPDLRKLAEKGFTKAIYIGEPDYLENMQVDLKSTFGTSAHITKSTPYFLEVTHPEANKGAALRYLAKVMDIDISETIGIGDNYNDTELVAAAGLGVAMGNAVDSLKNDADFITLSNNEEGVKHVIEKFVLTPSLEIK